MAKRIIIECAEGYDITLSNPTFTTAPNLYLVKSECPKQDTFAPCGSCSSLRIQKEGEK
jgi:hypothetical protein